MYVTVFYMLFIVFLLGVGCWVYSFLAISTFWLCEIQFNKLWIKTYKQSFKSAIKYQTKC